MRRRIFGTVAGLSAVAMMVAGCGSSDTPGTSSTGSTTAASAAAKGKVGVILPDTASSARWETADRPFLEEAFKTAGVDYDIQNANGDKAKFQTIADSMLAGGVTVLMIVNLDSDTGAVVAKKAAAQGVAVIDYDRLTLGGGSNYYVSFDNVAVGTKIGEGLVKCLDDEKKTTANVVLLNGSPTDNNATLFKQGYEKVIKDKGYTIIADQAVKDWDNTEAGRVFEQIFAANGAKIQGVAAANDGLAGAVISVLVKNGLAGKVPVTGQDATDEGLQRVLLGTQCMSVYKAVKKEAQAASDLAIALIKGDKAAADALATGTTPDSVTGKDVPSVLLEPVGIYAESVKDVVSDGFTTAAKLCTTADLKTACEKYGVK